MKISIIGIGRMGGALAIALSKKGFEIENLMVRNFEKAGQVAELIAPEPNILIFDKVSAVIADIIFITTPDSEIENVAANLIAKINQKTDEKPFVFHTSGSRSSEILNNLKEIGCKTGSLHPLVSISDHITGADSFRDVFFCVEGDAEAVAMQKEIVEKLGGKSFSIETKYKTLYHAAAVTACGHLVALIDAALEMLEKCGLDESSGRQILLPLIKSTIENLEQQTTAAALTGTFARADAETLRRQIDALTENVSPEALDIFLQLGRRSVHLAEMQGANREKLEEVQKVISLAKKNFRC